MAYFNHAFHKVFLGTGFSLDGQSAVNPVVPGVTYSVSSDSGYVTTSGLPTYMLNVLSRDAQSSPYSGPSSLSSWQSGYFGIFSPDTNLSITPKECCNIYIAGSAIYANDKIGPFHGGYTETNKSKMINPRYVQEFYRVDACEPQNHVMHIGSTFWTAGGGITGYLTSGTATLAPNLVNELINLDGGTGTGAQIIVSTDGAGLVTSFQIVENNGFAGKGYTEGDILTIPGDLGDFTLEVTIVTEANTDPVTGSGGASCCAEFFCGETYTLRVDIKGSPALRYLNHNAYYNTDAYTGCCPEGSIAPVAVDSTEVMIKWANGLISSPIVSPFLQIVIQDEAGVLWYEPGTSAADLAILGGDTWNNYVSPGHVDGACAGLILNGAYVDTKFGDCTFQITDFYEKEPVRLYASEVDFNGDPCEFTGICVVTECQPTQANGLGEQVLRDLILSESYRQNFLHTDLRIREITQGNQIVSAINRNALYTKYYLLHNVPRFNNPTGVFDNDRYLLEIVAENSMPQFEGTINEWLQNCGTECAFSEFTCLTECSSIQFPPLPVKRKVDDSVRPKL
jgi:hypothetical protein